MRTAAAIVIVTCADCSGAEPKASDSKFFADPNNLYYNVTIPDGTVFSFPQTQGHYSFKPAPAVTIQLQVAP